MEDALIRRPHRKRGLELQLTAMIDIFSMIVIFLILGSVFGASSMVIPPGLTLPKSVSKETVDSAPILSIEKEQVSLSILDPAASKIPIDAFLDSESVEQTRSKLKKLVDAKIQGAKEKDGKRLLNVVADKDLNYSTLFAVIKVFREVGYQVLLFSAIGEGVAK